MVSSGGSFESERRCAFYFSSYVSKTSRDSTPRRRMASRNVEYVALISNARRYLLHSIAATERSVWRRMGNRELLTKALVRVE